MLLFGGPKRQKERKFRSLEKQYKGSPEMIASTKASWLTSRGNRYGQQGKLDQAITDFREAIELKTDHIPAYIALGIAYREKGMLQEALTTLKNAPRKVTTFGKEFSGPEFDEMIEFLENLIQEFERDLS